MKRILGVVVALAMVASCLVGFEVSAAEVVLDGGFVVDGTVLVRYEGNDTHVVIPDGITEIGCFAFDGGNLLSIDIPSSVTIIDEQALYECQSLIEITANLSNANYSSADGVLFNKDKTMLFAYPAGKSESTYTIPEGIKTIGDYAFVFCWHLKFVDIPTSVETIGEEAFLWCTSLVSVDISSNVTKIGDNAFNSCSSLETVNIPTSVMTIGDNAFANGTSLKEITVSLDNANYSSADGVLFNKDKTMLFAYPAGKSESTYTIPNSVMTIDNYAFGSCTSLKSINIPYGVEIIAFDVFYGCTSLEFVSIPRSVTTIERGAFRNCTSLKSLYIPASVTEIWWGAFDGTTTLTVIEGSYAHQWAVENEQPYTLLSVTSWDSMQDVFNMLKLIASDFPLSEAQIAVADLNGDDKVTAMDALAAMKIIINKQLKQ